MFALYIAVCAIVGLFLFDGTVSDVTSGAMFWVACLFIVVAGIRLLAFVLGRLF